MPTSLKAASILAYVASAFFLASGISFLCGVAAFRSITPPDRSVDMYNQTQLEKLWEGRRAARGGLVTADMFQILAWLLLIAPIMAMTTVLGGQQRSATGLFSACFVLLATVNIIEFLFMAGAITVTDSMSYQIATDCKPQCNAQVLSCTEHCELRKHNCYRHCDVQLQNIELMYRIQRSRTLWLEACDHLFLCIATTAVVYLAQTTREKWLAKGWVVLTGIFAMLALIGFVSGLVRAVEYGVSDFGILRPVNGLYWIFIVAVMMPWWLTWLGKQLADNDGKDFAIPAPYVREINMSRVEPPPYTPEAGVGQDAQPTYQGEGSVV